MGNLESADGGPGEPPSVSLLPPPGKMPMPEPVELEERFALVLVRAQPRPFPLRPPPRSQRPGWDLAAAPPPAHPFSQGFRQTPSSGAFLSGSLRAAAGRPDSPVGGDEVSTTGHFGGGVPGPGLQTSPPAPLLCPPHFSPPPRRYSQAPRSSFLRLWPVRGHSTQELGPGHPEPKSGLSDWGDRLSC